MAVPLSSDAKWIVQEDTDWHKKFCNSGDPEFARLLRSLTTSHSDQ